MAKGEVPWDLVNNPRLDRPIGDIYKMLDARTDEVQPGEDHMHWRVTLFVMFPPTYLRGKFIKGFCFTDAPDLLLEKYPELEKLFFIGGYSMWSSYAWSRHAHAIFSLYPNNDRDAWWRKTHPDRKHQTLIPVLDSDWANELYMFPRHNNKDIDVLCVSRLDTIKNVPIVARAIKTYRDKYGVKLNVVWVTGTEFDINLKGLQPWEREVYRQVEDAVGHVADYFTIVPRVPSHEMPAMYSRARCYLLGSLYEGKNRGIEEAAFCDVPVACFADYNYYARNGTPLFPQGVGATAAQFTPESLADTVHRVLSTQADFRPRQNALKMFGRKRMFNRCIDAFPYFREAIPDYVSGEMHENAWLDLALISNYQIGLFDFMYGRNGQLAHQMGMEHVTKQIEGYIAKFKPWLSQIPSA